jgi:hypothetical protein
MKVVSDQWTWFADYGLAYAEWTVNCPGDRRCQVGMGIMVGGTPRGEKISFSPTAEFTTIGVGAIHVRVDDGGPPCNVRLDQGKVGTIPVPIPVP